VIPVRGCGVGVVGSCRTGLTAGRLSHAPNRIDEFIDAYLSNELNEDEKFALMETILQSFEESSKTLDSDQQWNTILQLLEDNLDIHATTICYWACGNSAYTLCWRITPDLRKIKLRNHLKITPK
jgi:hypothetical protein